MFAVLKKWKVLDGSSIDSIKSLEKELDTAMALHNLTILEREDRLGDIPAQARGARDAHIFSHKDLPQLHIPAEIRLEDNRFPSHLQRFHRALTSLAPLIRRAMDNNDRDCIFSNRVYKRATNLVAGGNVLQIAVQEAGGGDWYVRVHTGASMKNVVYKCFIFLREHVGIEAQAGECLSG